MNTDPYRSTIILNEIKQNRCDQLFNESNLIVFKYHNPFFFVIFPKNPIPYTVGPLQSINRHKQRIQILIGYDFLNMRKGEEQSFFYEAEVLMRAIVDNLHSGINKDIIETINRVENNYKPIIIPDQNLRDNFGFLINSPGTIQPFDFYI